MICVQMIKSGFYDVFKTNHSDFDSEKIRDNVKFKTINSFSTIFPYEEIFEYYIEYNDVSDFINTIKALGLEKYIKEIIERLVWQRYSEFIEYYKTTYPEELI
jgi:dissimilatory sulfite reductase (desulfoviridin) alpha/beta subunit